MAEGWFQGEPGVGVGQKGSLGDHSRRVQADRRLRPRVAFWRVNAGRKLSPRVKCRRWGGVGKSCTAGTVSAFRRMWKRCKSLEKAKTVSRTVIQQRTVEQIVAKVVELAPQMVVRLVEEPKSV